jgi:hypothetical protein
MKNSVSTRQLAEKIARKLGKAIRDGLCELASTDDGYSLSLGLNNVGADSQKRIIFPVLILRNSAFEVFVRKSIGSDDARNLFCPLASVPLSYLTPHSGYKTWSFPFDNLDNAIQDLIDNVNDFGSPWFAKYLGRSGFVQLLSDKLENLSDTNAVSIDEAAYIWATN